MENKIFSYYSNVYPNYPPSLCSPREELSQKVNEVRSKIEIDYSSCMLCLPAKARPSFMQVKKAPSKTETLSAANTQLIHAVQQGDHTAVEILIEAGAKLETALLHAIKLKEQPAIEALIAAGANLYISLIEAKKEKDPACLIGLVQAGACPRQALKCALEKQDYTSMLEFIHACTHLEKGPIATKKEDQTSIAALVNVSHAAKYAQQLLSASQKGDFLSVQTLLDTAHSFEFDMEFIFLKAKEIAVIHGHKEIVEKILELEKIMEDESCYFLSNDSINHLLLLAAICGHTPIVKMLVNDFQANVNVCSSNEMSACMHAAFNGHTDVVKFFREEARAASLGSGGLYNCFSMAVLGNHPDTVKYIFDKVCVIDRIKGYSVMELALPFGNKRIIDLLQQQGYNLEVGNEFLRRKGLAHIWGIAGTSKLIDQGKPFSFDLQSHTHHITMRMLSKCIDDFFQCNRDLYTLIPKEKIEEAISRSFSEHPLIPIGKYTTAEILSKIDSMDPVLLAGGSFGHAIALLIGKNKLNEYQLIVCNRGEGSFHHTVKFYLIPSSQFNEELIEKLRTTYPNIQSFNRMIEYTKLKYLDGYQQKLQKVGNCTWASGKAAFRALCEWYTDRETAKTIYKRFSRGFVREKILKDYMDQTQEPDVELLTKIQHKIKKKLSEDKLSISDNKTLLQLDHIIKKYGVWI